MSEVNTSVSGERVRKPRKPKKSQIPYAILVTILIIAFGFYLAGGNNKLPVYWGFGIAFGYILQRSRFCFTAAFRDPCITGSTSVTRAVLVAVAVGSVGFWAIKYASVMANAESNYSMASVSPIGLPLIIGAVMFGTGMVIAGGCASGTLMRVGEGFAMQVLSLVFFIAGSFWGAHDMNFWSKFNKNAPKIFLPDVFGWFGAILVQGLIIVLLYIAAVKWQEKKMGSAE
ncbi:MAG: transporter [Lacrimispora celerecrescens]|uniref:YeeE/YedE thiosulfate transporter family protein n=1 Tax=Lacrimispora indolis TaxID=69825 RepID=UPI00041667DA|nr:YeeE/YedE thiosulfate transporter family protein [[Clostridium] methoxybenzovorans]MBE7718147.1 transporter [Lacrimispora celerecrescens]